MSVSTTYAGLKTLRSDNNWKFYYEERSTDDTVDSYIVITGAKDTIYYARAAGADKTDFDNNFKSAATKADSFNQGISLASQDGVVFHLFNSEALADGVFEDSIVVSTSHASKTFTIENKHATGDLKYKIWGSANNTDFEEIKSETLLAAQVKTAVVNNDMWKFMKIEAKGDGAASTIDAYLQVGQ